MRKPIVLFAIALPSCLAFANPSHSSATDTAVLDAIALIMLGAEEGQTRDQGAPPVERKLDGSGIEYTIVEDNPRFGATYGRTESKFVKKVVRVEGLQKCWFSLRTLRSYSKGEEADNFDDAAATKSVTDLDLRKAFNLGVDVRDVGGDTVGGVIIKGSNVVCTDGRCGTELLIGVGNYELWRSEGEREFPRVERAIALVKERCPQKPK